MSSTFEQYEASIERINAIASEHGLERVAALQAYRQALKTVIRLHRRITAEEPDQDVRRVRWKQLGCLKRMHWKVIELERIAVVKAMLHN